MDLRPTADEAAFRDEVRGFIRENLPDELRQRMARGHAPGKQDTIAWQRALNRRGWATPTWPKEYGGPGWTPLQRLIFLEELSLAPAPEPLGFNSTMIGPVLIAFGTDEQKQMLPAIANLDIWFCQGFSEPGAGSDLASLRTRAVRDGEDYVVNGQKIWTSTAHNADWIFALVRTDPTAKKQLGISFLLIDMKTPGITVRPIIDIGGRHHLNEVFFDDVRVPAKNLVHQENRGWDVAKFLLGNERTGIARVGASRARLAHARELARDARSHGRPLIEDRGFRERVAMIDVELRALEITQMRIMSAAMKEAKQDPRSSILKLKGSELAQAAHQLCLAVGGPAAFAIADHDDDRVNEEPDPLSGLAPAALVTRAATIYGGSSEIQRNIIAKAVLGFR